jgi:hypothetical protein
MTVKDKVHTSIIVGEALSMKELVSKTIKLYPELIGKDHSIRCRILTLHKRGILRRSSYGTYVCEVQYIPPIKPKPKEVRVHRYVNRAVYDYIRLFGASTAKDIHNHIQQDYPTLRVIDVSYTLHNLLCREKKVVRLRKGVYQAIK